MAIVTACAGMPIGEPACPTVVNPVRIGQLAGDEVGAASRAARFGVVVGEQHAFCGELVDVGRPPRHHAAVVSADVPDADIVSHDEDDIRLAAGAPPAPPGLWIAAPGPSSSLRGGQCEQRSAAQEHVSAIGPKVGFAPSLGCSLSLDGTR